MNARSMNGFGRYLFGVVFVGLGVLSNLATSPAVDGKCVPGTEQYETAGDMQSGAASAPLGGGLRLKYSCSIMNPQQNTLPKIYVTWAVTRGGGRVNGQTVTTVASDVEGTSEVHWSLGPLPGVQTATATLSGQTYTFTATATLPTLGGNCNSGPGTTFENPREIVGDETWTLAGSPYRAKDVTVADTGTLTIEPGVTVCLQGTLLVPYNTRLVAEGKSGQEIRFTVADLARQSGRLVLSGRSATNLPGSSLKHVIADNVTDVNVSTPGVQIEDSRFVIDPSFITPANICNAVRLHSYTENTPVAAPSVIRRTLFDGYGSRNAACEAAVTLGTVPTPTTGVSVFQARVRNAPRDAVNVPGVSSATTWSLQSCDITQNGGDGVVFENTAAILGTNPGATVVGCSITNNTGLGLNNKRAASYTVNARGNWWGDAAGPAGPKGDGVSPGVDIAAPLAAPPALGY